jgi:hypothetical protein
MRSTLIIGAGATLIIGAGAAVTDSESLDLTEVQPERRRTPDKPKIVSFIFIVYFQLQIELKRKWLPPR